MNINKHIVKELRMDFAKALLKAYETRWSYINTFEVQILFSSPVASYIGWTKEDERNINLNIVSIDTPQFSNSPIEVYQGDRWKIHNGRDEMYKFSITFRDQDQMALYRKFVSAYMLGKHQYFNVAKMHITLWKEADYLNESAKKTLFDFADCMIDSVSQLQFSNVTENQIAEFTVQFKTATPILTPFDTKGA